MKDKKIYQIIKVIAIKSYRNDIISLASQLTYSLIIAFFPFLFFTLTIINNTILKQEYIFEILQKIVPGDAYNLVYNTVMELIGKKQNGSAMIFTMILAILTAAMGFNAVIKCLNKSYHEHEERSFLKMLFISIISTLALAFIIILALILLIFEHNIEIFAIRYLGYKNAFNLIWDFLRYTIMFSIMIFTFAGIYRYAPTKKVGWKNALPGSFFTSINWIVVSWGFSYYVSTFANYSRLYGSIGAMIVLMVWIFLTSIIVLIGGELNATLQAAKL